MAEVADALLADARAHGESLAARADATALQAAALQACVPFWLLLRAAAARHGAAAAAAAVDALPPAARRVADAYPPRLRSLPAVLAVPLTSSPDATAFLCRAAAMHPQSQRVAEAEAFIANGDAAGATQLYELRTLALRTA